MKNKFNLSESPRKVFFCYCAIDRTEEELLAFLNRHPKIKGRFPAHVYYGGTLYILERDWNLKLFVTHKLEDCGQYKMPERVL